LPVYEISNNFRYLLNIPRFSKLPTVEIYWSRYQKAEPLRTLPCYNFNLW
jgi:hypothetical protein